MYLPLPREEADQRPSQVSAETRPLLVICAGTRPQAFQGLIWL